MWKNYLKTAIRNLLRHPGFSLLNLAGLSIGISVSLLLMLWVQRELRFDRFHKSLPRLYQVHLEGTENGERQASNIIPYRLVPEMMKTFPEIVDGTRLQSSENTVVTYGDLVFNENRVILTDPGFFNLFDFPLLVGDPKEALQDPLSVMITQSTATKLFAGDDPIGKMLQINNEELYRVTGIVEDPPGESSIQFDYIFPLSILGERVLNSWSYELEGMILLEPGVNIEDFRAKIKSSLRDLSPRDADVNDVGIQSFSRIHLYDTLDRPASLIYVIIFSIVGLSILVIACINYLNLAMARALTRSREVGIRKVVGAVRGQIIQQFVLEAMIMVVIAILISLLLVEVAYPLFNRLAGSGIAMRYTNPVLILSVPVIVLFAGLIAGLYPAIYLSTIDSITVLKGGSNSKPNQLFRKALLVFQFFATITLLICSFVIIRQFKYIHTKDLGFNQDLIVCLDYHDEYDSKIDVLRQKLVEHPNIIDMTEISSPPNIVWNINTVDWEGKPSDDVTIFYFLLTDDHYLDVMNLQLVAGRNFSEKPKYSPDIEYIVNEKAVSLMGMDDPIGKKFTMWESEGTIVGVIKDYHNRPVTEDILPMLICQLQWFRSYYLVKIAPDDIAGSLEHIRNVSLEVAPGVPFSYNFLDTMIRDEYRGFERSRNIVIWFAVFAAFISCMGLFGLSAFIVRQRTREIGIRKVLGASVMQTSYLLMKEFLALIGISILPAIALAWFFSQKFLDIFQFHIRMQWYDFALPILAVFVVAITTLGIKVVNAAMQDPASSLRTE